MSKADFVAFQNGDLKISVHLPQINASNQLKLYQHVSTLFRIKDRYQLMVDDDDQLYIAIGSIGAQYIILIDLDDCTLIRGIKSYKKW